MERYGHILTDHNNVILGTTLFLVMQKFERDNGNQWLTPPTVTYTNILLILVLGHGTRFVGSTNENSMKDLSSMFFMSTL